MPTKFTLDVQNAIHGFLSQNDKVFANERDLQMHLAVYLKEKEYDVEVEYYVPSDVISPLLPPSPQELVTYYPWFQANSDKPQEMYVDLVISNGKEYVPVELKYRKKQLKGNLTLFGQDMGKGILLKNDSAQDFGRYGFWKDVRRVEFLTKAFGKIKNGIVLFLTNDASYNALGTGNSKHLSMGNGSATYHKDTNGSWPFNPLDTKAYKSSPNFKLTNEHDVAWKSYTYSGIGFHCAEVVV